MLSKNPFSRCFIPCLVKSGQVVLGKKSKIWKVCRQTDGTFGSGERKTTNYCTLWRIFFYDCVCPLLTDSYDEHNTHNIREVGSYGSIKFYQIGCFHCEYVSMWHKLSLFIKGLSLIGSDFNFHTQFWFLVFCFLQIELISILLIKNSSV